MLRGVCRRCGEPDQRGSSRKRRARRVAMLHGRGGEGAELDVLCAVLGMDAPGWGSGGNGVITACVWCADLVADRAGYLEIPAGPHGPARRLRLLKMEQDRLEPGARYSLRNCVASCGPCNRYRGFLQAEAAQTQQPDDCILVRGY